MSDVLIRGMEMPESCADCDLRTTTGYSRCKVNNHILSGYKLLSGEKDSKCPAIYVPTPHGDLIDKDAFFKSVIKHYCENCKHKNEFACEQCGVDDLINILIENAPVIIKAEEENK